MRSGIPTSPCSDRRRGWGRLRLAAVALAIAALPAGCGGSGASGIAAKPAGSILAAATRAAHSAKSVHVAGTVHVGGTVFSLHLELVAGVGAEGSISEGGLGFGLVATGGHVYIRGGRAFLRHFAGAAAAARLAGKWLEASASGQLAPLRSLTTIGPLFGQLLPAHGPLRKGATEIVDGRRVVDLRAVRGGTLYVAAKGTPYPIAIIEPGAGGGRVDFSGYDQPASIWAPSHAIDIAQLA